MGCPRSLREAWGKEVGDVNVQWASAPCSAGWGAVLWVCGGPRSRFITAFKTCPGLRASSLVSGLKSASVWPQVSLPSRASVFSSVAHGCLLPGSPWAYLSQDECTSQDWHQGAELKKRQGWGGGWWQHLFWGAKAALWTPISFLLWTEYPCFLHGASGGKETPKPGLPWGGDCEAHSTNLPTWRPQHPVFLHRHLCSPWPAGPPHPGPDPPLAHLLPPCPPCTSPAFLWCLEHARTLQPQGLCTCYSPHRSAFLNLHGIESLASSRPQFKCRLIRKAFHGHPVCAAACPFPCPDPHSLCSLTPSVFLPSISLT